MNINTHLEINQELCGKPVLVADKMAIVEMIATSQMAADREGLVHGGFVFGMADYAAMLAVNHPYVVLGSANTVFQKPVKVGEHLRAIARIVESKGRRHTLQVEVKRDDELVFSGEFACFVLDSHVLAR